MLAARIFCLVGLLAKCSFSTYTLQPVSLNASLNSMVTFTCEANGVFLIYFYVGSISAYESSIVQRGFTQGSQYTINGTVKRRSLSVYAQEINNNTDITCGTSPGDVRSNTVTLKIQGTVSEQYMK